MTQATITEALAELKVLQKRIASKREFILRYAVRAEHLKDPLEKDGGSVSAIATEIQSMNDLERNVLSIRRAIQIANENTDIQIENTIRTVADWLVWRREVAPGTRQFLSDLLRGIEAARGEAAKRNVALESRAREGVPTIGAERLDVTVNVNESELARRREELEAALETLDGKLSLKNATVVVSW